MAKYLVIVESPAKVKTIKKFLGSNYEVVASNGHVRDLPKSTMGIDMENDYEPKYITIRGKGDKLAELRRYAKKADKVYLATDPDREGEAISWHLSIALKLDPKKTYRITFNEITKQAVKESLKHPRDIEMGLVDAQQARRVLDRMVGYSISPLLWMKIKRGLSAGRVQSVALKMLCDREDEINAFIPKEYWDMDAVLKHKNKEFTVSFYGDNKGKLEITGKEQLDGIVKELKDSEFTVKDIKKGSRTRKAPIPFTTSTLQQEASKALNFSTQKTMRIAQQLYEGVDIKGRGTIGLITYMRTDSLRIADDAQKEAVAYLTENYGSEYVKAKQYKTKKNAQDAHEAIRPTSINIKPIDIKDKLTNDQYRLYKLIWERFAASQMTSAVYDTMQVTIDANGHTFKASGSNIKFKGYMTVYVESTDNKEKKEKMLPNLEENQTVALKSSEEKQHFTQPPARYSDATLIKELEENGIGRPSTYAPTISTIVSRGYVVRSKKQLVPTELGFVTSEIMKNNFSDIVDVEFTADMEKELDSVEEGELNWKKLINDFYPSFKDTLEKAQKNIEKIQIKDEESDVVCEKCGRKMVYKLSKFGKFLACPGYPECKNTKAIREETGAKCPKCGGEILVKKSRRGKVYYGCEHSPKCDFMVWDMPVKDEACPQCGGLLLKKQGRNGKIFCYNEDCKYERKLKDEKK